MTIPPRQRAALEAVRQWTADHGTGSTIAQLARALNVKRETAGHMVDRLRLGGWLQLAQNGSRPLVVKNSHGQTTFCPGPPLVANRPQQEALALIREASELLDVVPVSERARRDAWRERAAKIIAEKVS